MQGRTCKKYGKKAGMKAHQATLLLNKAKKKHVRLHYIHGTFLQWMYSVVWSSLSFFFSFFGSRVAQGAFIPILFPYFLPSCFHTSYMTNFYRKFFTENFYSQLQLIVAVTHTFAFTWWSLALWPGGYNCMYRFTVAFVILYVSTIAQYDGG